MVVAAIGVAAMSADARNQLRLEVFVRPDHSVVQSASLDTTTGGVLRTSR